MKKVKVGICRIYSVKKLTIPEATEFCIDFTLGDIDVVASISPKTRHETFGAKLTSQKAKRAKTQTTSAGPHEFSRPGILIGETYCEIVSTLLLEVGDDLADSFLAFDTNAKDEIFKIADKKKQHLFSSLDYVAGFVDLNLDYSLARTLVFEQSYAYYDDSSGCTASSQKTNKIGSFGLNKNPGWVAEFMQVYPTNSDRNDWEKKAQILAWLIRAWSTRDLIHKFISLFFIVERIIPRNLPVANINKWQEKRQKVLTLVKKYANPEELQEITEFVKGMKNRISLPNRFESWAAHIMLPGWREDVIAFELLNEKRSKLINVVKLRVKLRDVLGSGRRSHP